MSDDALTSWIDEWSARYSGYSEDLLKELAGRHEFDEIELARIVEWKNKRQWPARKLRDISGFEERRPGRIAELTRLAFAARDPEIALHILTLLPGVRARTASAVLTAHDASRYTIMDKNALKALRGEPVLGLQEELARVTANLPSGDGWWRALFPEWLGMCHQLANRSSRSLRVVDQALMARGQAS